MSTKQVPSSQKRDRHMNKSNDPHRQSNKDLHMVDPEYTISSPTGGLKVKPHSKQETDDGLRAS